MDATGRWGGVGGVDRSPIGYWIWNWDRLFGWSTHRTYILWMDRFNFGQCLCVSIVYLILCQELIVRDF